MANQSVFFEVRTMPPKGKQEEKPPVVTVKIHASLHSMAKKIAAFTDERIEDILSDLLREPLAKKLRKVMAEAKESE